jgi:hypothetical protein
MSGMWIASRPGQIDATINAKEKPLTLRLGNRQPGPPTVRDFIRNLSCGVMAFLRHRSGVSWFNSFSGRLVASLEVFSRGLSPA